MSEMETYREIPTLDDEDFEEDPGNERANPVLWKDETGEDEEPAYEDCKGFQGGCGSPSCLSCNPPEPCCYVSYQTRGAQHHVTCEEYR